MYIMILRKMLFHFFDLIQMQNWLGISSDHLESYKMLIDRFWISHEI